MKQLTYRIVLREEPEGGFTVTVPTLPGCITYGKDRKEAYEMAEDAIIGYLQSQKKHKEEIYDDSQTLEGLLTIRI